MKTREENEMTTVALDIDELREICDLMPEDALRRATPFLTDLLDAPAFLEGEILPILRESRGARDWYVARRHDADDGSYSLKVFVWPAGTGTKVHDHSSWGVYACAWGCVLEERYERLDDGT